jgi:hypothetical protein
MFTDFPEELAALMFTVQSLLILVRCEKQLLFSFWRVVVRETNSYKYILGNEEWYFRR